MSGTLSVTGADGSTVVTAMLSEQENGHPPARDAIRAEVESDGSLVLRPNNALGAMYLHRFGHGDLQPQWSYRGLDETSKGDPYSPLMALRLKMRTRPLLSTGGDPYFTGMSLSRDEQEACRALVGKMRGHTHRCIAKTTKGRQCKNHVGVGEKHCAVHRQSSGR